MLEPAPRHSRHLCIQDVVAAAAYRMLLLLYRISDQQKQIIMNMGNNTNGGWEWKLSWRRALFDSEIQMADNFLGELSQQQIQPNTEDRCSWKHDQTGYYSTKSGYDLIWEAQMGANQNLDFVDIWKLKIPSKSLNLKKELNDLEAGSSTGILSQAEIWPIWWETISWLSITTVFPSNPAQHFLQHSFAQVEGLRRSRWQSWWMAVVWSIWKMRNIIIFSNDSFNGSKLVDDAVYLVWTWLINLDKDFKLHFNQWSTHIREGFLVMKSILRVFEMASGLKINYAKSQFGCMGKSKAWCREAALFLNCGQLQFPFPYLGIPVGSSSRKCSPWWKDLRAVFQQQHSHSLINNMRWKVGDGAKIRFWKDKWREGDLTLQAKYPALFQISTQQNHSINSMGLLIDNRWEWQFQWRRNLFEHEISTAAEFMADIEHVHIQPSARDLLLWNADPGGSYTTKSAYNLLKANDRQAPVDSATKIIWTLKIPPRAIAFAWRIFKNRLPTKDNLRRRHVVLLSFNCPLCDMEEESVGHVMYSCIKTRHIWWEALGWVNRVGPFPLEPRYHFQQFCYWSRKTSVEKRWQVLWIALSMTIWKHRNSLIFKNQTFSSEKVMDEALFHTWSWLCCMEQDFHTHFNQWSIRLKEELSDSAHFSQWWKDLRSVFQQHHSNSLIVLGCVRIGLLELEINCEKTRSLWWERMRWVNRVGSYSIDPKNHFLQFTQWNSKDSTNKRWEFLWLALSFSIWYHRNAKIFKNQPFTPEKVMDDALFHTWSWIKCVEKDFQMHFNFWSTNLKDVLS
ncbi:putative ribonuclease H protein [Glycine soja]